MTIDNSQTFRNALSAFPSGVTIVSTTDSEGRHWGFTASSFSSVSMNPPLVLVCLANTAESHPAFLAASRYTINILAQDQKDFAMHFARKGVDKFGPHAFRFGTVEKPHPPMLPGSMAALVCSAHDVYAAGDHTVLIGEIEAVELVQAQPLIYFNRGFRRLELETADSLA